MALGAGTRLGAYEIVAPLGSGGMGAVYRATDLQLGREVAIKVLLPNLAQDPDALARFKREARAASALNHPHLVQIYEIAEARTAAGVTHYIAMELVDGVTMRAHLKPGSQRTHLIEALIPVADALARAHRAGIVHRDLKPENILITTDGYPKVVDFGLAKLAEASEVADGRPTALYASTRPGVIVGTVGYMAPEQVHGLGIDHRADIFSFGCILYEVATGQPAFKRESSVATLHAVAYEEPAPIESLNASASSDLCRVVGRCLAKEPAQRYQTMSDLAAELRPLVRGRATPSSNAATVLVGRASSKQRQGFRAAFRWSAAAVLTAGAVAAGLWFRSASAPATGRATGPPSTGEQRLVVAVTPFYGPDEESAKEGKVMAAMVERAIVNRLGASNVAVLGVDQTKQPARSHDEARTRGASLGATMVVWGEAFAVRGETEIQPYFTMVPREKQPDARTLQPPELLADSSAGLKEREVEPTVVQAQAANQIELRRTGAAGVGDIVLLLAGTHALYTEGKAEKALALFEQGPRTAERLRYQTEALLQLKRNDQALSTLQDAAALAPDDPKTYAMLGDVHMAAGRFEDAAAAYRRAADLGGSYTTREAILYDGKLYARETFRNPFQGGAITDTGYMLAFDLATGRVLERHRLPDPLKAFTPHANAIEITYDLGFGFGTMSRYATIMFSGGRFQRPVFYGTWLLLRSNAMRSGESLAANFLADERRNGFDAPSKRPYEDAPKTLRELEAAGRRAFERDPTQPWHLFVLGQALWSQERPGEAIETWDRLFAGTFPATPYYEYMRMAYHFERFGQRQWADRAFDEALKRRQQIPQPVDASFMIERLINVGIPGRINGLDLERAYTWLDRSRQLSGVAQGDELASVVWQRYFAERGDVVRARHEAEYFERARANALSSLITVAGVDYAAYVFLATSFTLWTVAALLFAPRRTGGGVISSISKSQRMVLAAAATVALLAAFPLGVLVYGAFNISALLPATDSLGHAHVIQSLEKSLETSNTRERRFAAAVAHHLAGDEARARELYESLPGDSRAAQNLEALKRGVLVPPVPLTADDRVDAYSDPFFHRFWAGLGIAAARPLKNMPSISGRVVFVVDAALAAILLLACWRIPASEAYRESAALLGGSKSRLTRITHMFVPGAFDIGHGPVWRGYLAVSLFIFTLVVGFNQVYLLLELPGPAPGLFFASTPLFRGDPLPTPSGRIDANPASYHYWTLFWAYPYATIFWSIVALAAVTSLSLHVLRLRQNRSAWREQPAESH